MNDLEMPIKQLAYYCNNTRCCDCKIKKMILCTERGQSVGDGGCDIPAYWEVKTDE